LTELVFITFVIWK